MKIEDCRVGQVGLFKRTTYRILSLHPEFNAITIGNGNGTLTCRPEEFEPEPDRMARIEAQEAARLARGIAKDREKYAHIIKAWEAGHRDRDSISSFLNVRKNTISKQLKAAMTIGLLK